MRRTFDVIAHRGASARAPENTLEAVRQAHALGATAVECDVHRTRDGVLVVHHDETLGRTVPGDERIADLTWGELCRRDAGVWFGREYAGQRVPRLSDWLSAVGERHGMFVEVKSPSCYPGIAADLDALLRDNAASASALAQGRLTVQSFDHGWLQVFKQCAPDVAVGALVNGRLRRRAILEIASWAEQLNPWARTLTSSMVGRAQQLGLRVHPWTVDELLTMHRLAAWGVDGIITNRPGRLTSMLERAAS